MAYTAGLLSAQQVELVGSEFVVEEEGNPADPNVGATPTGGFIVVWRLPSPAPMAFGSVHRRRYAADITPLEEPTLIDDSYFWPYSPDVGSNSSGKFVVTWSASVAVYHSYPYYGNLYINRARRYNADGSPLGSVSVNPSLDKEGWFPTISFAPNNGFFVVWTEWPYRALPSSSDTDVGGRSFNANATPITTLIIATTTTGRQGNPSVATNRDGNALVAWESEASSGDDSDSYSVQAQLLTPTGIHIGNELQVNSTTAGGQRYPDVAATGIRDFIAVWRSSSAIKGRLISSTGTTIGAELQIGYGSQAVVASDPMGGFLAVWKDYSTATIVGRFFNSHGEALRDKFQISPTTLSYVSRPDVTTLATGDFLAVWQGSVRSIYGQLIRFNRAIFADDFESGDADAWPEVIN